MTKLAHSVDSFIKTTLPGIIEHVGIANNISGEDLDTISKQPVVRMIAYATYLSEIPNPDEVAVLRIGAFIQGARHGEFFAHRPNQTIEERISLLFIGTHLSKRPEVDQAAAAILCSISANDHLNDLEEDRLIDHGNPILQGILDIVEYRKEINKKIEGFDPGIVRELETLAPRHNVFWN
jgi:hypothetical protein